MMTTYKAVLRGNRLDWRSDAPRHLAPDEAVNVHVTVLDEAAPVEVGQGRRMAEALERLAQSQALAGVDAGRWERETRAERVLPGRDEDAD